MRLIRAIIEKHADRLGIAGSVLCLLHCLAVPVLAFLTTGIAAGHQHIAWFPGDDYFFITLCMVTVYFASRKAGRYIKLSLLLCMLVFSTSLLMSRHFAHPEWVELSGHFAAVGLIVTHLFNIRVTRKKAGCTTRLQKAL